MKNLLAILTLFSTMVGSVYGEPSKEAGKPTNNLEHEIDDGMFHPEKLEYEVDDGMFHPERSETVSNDDLHYKAQATSSVEVADKPVKRHAYTKSRSRAEAFSPERDGQGADGDPNYEMQVASPSEAAQIRKDQNELARAINLTSLKQKQAQTREQSMGQAIVQQQNELNRARAQQQERVQQQAQVRYSQQPQARAQQQPQEQQGAIDPRTGEYFAPTGDGGYVGTRNGHVMAPAGPDQVVDTRTGKFVQKY